MYLTNTVVNTYFACDRSSSESYGKSFNPAITHIKGQTEEANRPAELSPRLALLTLMAGMALGAAELEEEETCPLSPLRAARMPARLRSRKIAGILLESS